MRKLAVLLLALAWPAASRADTDLAVFAASSLKEAFELLGSEFEKAHPGVKVKVALAGSQELATQIDQGARADLFASASKPPVAALEQKGLLVGVASFARNEPVVVLPRGNPAGIRSLADLPRARRLVIGAPEVPIGTYTLRIFEAAGRRYGADFRKQLEAAVVSRELNVRQVLAKVALGEADAGIVYRTDARAAKDKVDVVVIPAEVNAIAEYPIAAVKASKQPALARAFIDLVLSAEGQRRLVAAGFLPAAARAPGK